MSGRPRGGACQIGGTRMADAWELFPAQMGDSVMPEGAKTDIQE